MYIVEELKNHKDPMCQVDPQKSLTMYRDVKKGYMNNSFWTHIYLDPSSLDTTLVNWTLHRTRSLKKFQGSIKFIRQLQLLVTLLSSPSFLFFLQNR